MRRIHVVINPASGQDQPVLAILNRQLGKAGIEWTHSVSKGAGDIGKMANDAVEHADVIAVYGGDGTVGEAASAVRGRRPLAIFPGGTGNVISAELGIPQELEVAVADFAAGHWNPVDIDALEVDGRRYYLRVGFGADARMIEGADREEKDRLGWLAYLRTAMAEAWAGEIVPYRIEIDGEARDIEAVTVVVANIGRIGRGGLRIGTSVNPMDHRADVFVVRRTDIPAWTTIGAAFLGEVDADSAALEEDAPLLHLHAHREVRIDATPEQPGHGDGDLIGKTPKRVTLVRGGATILRPPSMPD